MKELTIEQKAQAYDEAIKRAKELLEIGLKDTRDKRVVLSFFPELKENEDERIKKALLDYFDDANKADENPLQNYGIHTDKAIAWLEKQGEHANFLSKIQVGDKVTRNEGGVLVNISQLERVAKPRKVKPADKVEPKFKVKYAGSEYNVLEVKDIAGVTYYGIEDEPNHIDYVKAENCDIISGYAIKENGSPYPAKSAVFSEQKPFDYENANIQHKDFAPKQEPKFHKGEWIITKANNLYQVTAIIDDKYQLKYGDNYTVQKCADVDKIAHLWTIQDAKDGDVLASELCDSIILFRGIKDNNIDFYCDYDFSKIDVLGDRFAVYGNVKEAEDLHPATKEQRDLLFQKMKEAGYEWDAEKKELKKIGNEIGEIEIPFGAKDSELQEVTYYIPKGFHVEIDDDKVVILKGEKPVKWSEEDEMIVLSIEQIMNRASFLSTPKQMNEIRTWLKSLKDRVQSKQELDGTEIAPPIDSDVCG